MNAACFRPAGHALATKSLLLFFSATGIAVSRMTAAEERSASKFTRQMANGTTSNVEGTTRFAKSLEVGVTGLDSFRTQTDILNTCSSFVDSAKLWMIDR